MKRTGEIQFVVEIQKAAKIADRLFNDFKATATRLTKLIFELIIRLQDNL